MADQAYKGVERHVVESTAVYMFLTGLKNKEIGYQVLNQMPPPADMAMALKLVKSVQVTQSGHVQHE